MARSVARRGQQRILSAAVPDAVTASGPTPLLDTDGASPEAARIARGGLDGRAGRQVEHTDDERAVDLRELGRNSASRPRATAR